MHINLSPQIRPDKLSVHRSGDVLNINDVDYDFGSIQSGATLPNEAIDCEFIVGEVERIGGKLHITLLLPVGADASDAARFPEPIIDPADGVLELPV